MNELQNQFLGAYLAVIIRNEVEFESFRGWMGQNNLFLTDKSPAGNMKYPGDMTFAIYRHDDAAIYWTAIIGLDQNKYKAIDVADFFKNVTESDQNVIEDAGTVIDEVSNIDLDVSITSVVPAVITSNIKDLKEVTIPKIQQYAKTVVTAENYKEIDGMLTNLRNARKSLNDGKIATKKEASKTIVVFEEDVKEILAAFDSVIEKLATQTKEFKEAEKKAKKKELETTINQLKDVLIKNNMISKEYANKFVFDEKWLNKSTTQKAFKEAVEKQFNDLMEQEKKDKEVLGSIKSLIKSLEPVPGMMKPETYITLYQQGMLLGDVLAKISMEAAEMDIKINKSNKMAVENAREEIVQETIQNLEKGVQVVQESTQSVQETSMIVHVDEKTGEVFARSNDDKIIMKMAEDKNPEKIWEYTYQFKGNFRAIKTFNNFMNVLSKINKTFSKKEIKE